MNKPVQPKQAVNPRMVLFMLAVGCLLLAPVEVCVNGQQSSVKGNLPAKYQPLRKELDAMYREDQATRISAMQTIEKLGVSVSEVDQLKDPQLIKAFEKVQEKMKRVDEKNRQRLKQIIAEHGWLGISQVGEQGALVFWIIAQHADDDVDFQKRCLKLMEAASAGEVQRKHLAYLTDRILVNENKPQRYGTQMDNHFQPRPLEDPDNVDKLRATMGLPPLSEYLRVAKEQYKKIATIEAESGGVTEQSSD